MKITKTERSEKGAHDFEIAEVNPGADLNIVTARGTLRVRENRDGSLEIRGTEHNLAVFPKTANSLHVYLLDPLTVFGTTDPHAVVTVPSTPQWAPHEVPKGVLSYTADGPVKPGKDIIFSKGGPVEDGGTWYLVLDVVKTVRDLQSLPKGTKLFSTRTKHSWEWHGNDATPLVATGTGGGYTFAGDFIEHEAPLTILHKP